MSHLLRANTAVDVLIGPFLDSTDGNTNEIGLTIAQADVRLSKNGQNMAQKNDANAAAHDELGYHNCPLNATDTNTEGQLDLLVHEAGALAVRHQYSVISEAAWDSLFAAKDVGFMDVNIKTVGRADAQETEANNLESACSNYSVTRGLTGTALPAVAADGVGGLPISDAGGLDMDAILADTNELQGDWANAGRLDAILDAIPTTAMRGTDNAALASVVGALNDVAAAGDPTEADTLVQYIKQLLNVLIGTTGITTWPAEAAPANGVSIAEALRAVAVDVATTIPGTITTAQNDLDTITGASGVILQDGTIVAATLGADCLTSAKIADNAFLAVNFGADFLTSAKIADDAIVAANLATGCLTADAFAADAIVAATLATGALSADAFAADALVAATFATGAFTADAFAANALIAATFNADCITAAKVAADVHTENATAVWAKENATLTKTYGLIMEQIYQFLHNDMNITDATGAVALRNLANDGDMATWGITDNDTTTARTDVVWV